MKLDWRRASYVSDNERNTDAPLVGAAKIVSIMRSSREETNYYPVRQANRTFTPNDVDFDNLQRTQVKEYHLHPDLRLADSRSQSSDFQSHEDKSDAEEVYVCNCCGISREVGPSVQFMSVFKTCFFLFNFLALVGGFANLGMGLWLRIDPKVYEIHKYIETQNFTIAGWIILFAGFLAIITSLIGFGAASRQSAGSLVFYFVVMISLTVAFVGGVVLFTVYGLGKPLERFLVKEIYEQIRRRATNTGMDSFISSDAAQFVDFIQVKMRCCGAASFTDYARLGMVVPTTCYTIDRNYISAPGCGEAIRRLFDIRIGLAVGFSSASILLQLFTIILSALMFCSIYNWRREDEYSRRRMQTPTMRRALPLYDNAAGIT